MMLLCFRAPCHVVHWQVKGVNQSNGVYAALAAIMLLACLAFGITWAACMVVGVMNTVRQRRMHKLLIRASKTPSPQQAACVGVDTVEDRRADVEAPEPVDRSMPVSHRGKLDRDRSGVRDVLNPLQRARKMLGSGASSRFIDQSSRNESVGRQGGSGTSATGCKSGIIPAAKVSGLVVCSNPLQRPRRLLGAGMGISSRLAVASATPRKSMVKPEVTGDLASSGSLGSSHHDDGGKTASDSGGTRVRMSTAALIARRFE
jgi:hypothetical protein